MKNCGILERYELNENKYEKSLLMVIIIPNDVEIDLEIGECINFVIEKVNED